MTIGVDQCMRCGKPIRQRRDSSKALDERPTTMSEAQWRAAGFLARPNRSQARQPALYCCQDCVAVLINREWKPSLRVLAMFGAIAAFSGLAWWLLMIFMP